MNNGGNKLIRIIENHQDITVITIWPIAHFFWGYSLSLPLVLVLIWVLKRKVNVKNTREFLKKRSVLGVLGGIWAMIPDVDYFLEDHIFSLNSLSDIFFFHISLDKVLPETDLFFAAEMLLIFAVINLLALVVTVDSFKRLNEIMFGKKPDKDDDFLDEEEDENSEQKGKSDD